MALDAPPKRPLLRYPGGKWKMGQWIVAHFPAHCVYVEPFAGAASVLLQKPRVQGEVINDLSSDVVNLHRVLRDSYLAARLMRQLSLTPFARAEYEAAFEALPSLDMVEQARRLIVRSFMGFGNNSVGLAMTGFRSMARPGTSSHHVPARTWATYADCLPAFTERLRGVVIEQDAASSVIARNDTPDTLFYCDPPYPVNTRSRQAKGQEKNFYAHDMTDDDHAALLTVLTSVRGMVALSTYPCPLYESILCPAGWERRTLATHADGATPRTEVLWLNPALLQKRSTHATGDNEQHVLRFEEAPHAL